MSNQTDNQHTQSPNTEGDRHRSQSFKQTIDLIRWDLRANQGWSFDHLRARLLLIEVRMEQYIYAKVKPKGVSGNLIWGLTRFTGSIFQWLLGHCNIPGSVTIGKGLRLPHPQNIVIAYRAHIGDFCTIYHDVSVVWNGFVKAKPHRPHIGDRVLIGTKALIIGDVVIGDDVLIGASAIVPKSVPSQSRVVNETAQVQHRPISDEAAEAGTAEHMKKPYSIWK